MTPFRSLARECYCQFLGNGYHATFSSTHDGRENMAPLVRLVFSRAAPFTVDTTATTLRDGQGVDHALELLADVR